MSKKKLRMEVIVTRKQLQAASKYWKSRIPSLSAAIKSRMEQYDHVCKGWTRATETWISVTRSDGSGGLDILTRLPGSIFLRGWDGTGAINRK